MHDIAQEHIQRAFGRRLHELRQIVELSQEDLALTAGLDRSYVGQIERGERNVSLVTIHTLAYALDVTPDAVLLSPGVNDATHHAQTNEHPAWEQAGALPASPSQPPRRRGHHAGCGGLALDCILEHASFRGRRCVSGYTHAYVRQRVEAAHVEAGAKGALHPPSHQRNRDVIYLRDGSNSTHRSTSTIDY